MACMDRGCRVYPKIVTHSKRKGVLIDELNRWANKLEQEKTRTNATPAKIINIENFKGVLGGVLTLPHLLYHYELEYPA
jgi:hypothetical protein